MNAEQNEPTLEESLKEVMQTLPVPIRQYLSSGQYSIVAQRLMQKYGLRIDQAGVLERQTMLLLMGINTPEEFSQALRTDAQLTEGVVNGVIGDVNQLIFVPLQAQMRGESSAVETMKPTQSVPQASPIAPSPATLPDIAPLPPKHALPPFSTGGPLRPVASEPPVTLPGVPGPLPAAAPVQPVFDEQLPPSASVNRLVSPPPSASVPTQASPVSPPPSIESYPVDPYRETPE